jgi:hypothetical protein
MTGKIHHTMNRIACIALIVLCFCVLPASAVILEVTVKGTVSAIDAERNTLTIADPARYGCDYRGSGDPICSYTPMADATLTGSVPEENAFRIFAAGDSVVATSLGGTGGTWITLAKLSGPPAAEETVTDIVGDPSTIATPLAGNYALNLTTEPDCTTCAGTTCTAATSLVKVLRGTSPALIQVLRPGSDMIYNGRNDGSSIAVTFVKGQALSAACAGSPAMMAGPQAISVYIVHVVPPIESGGQAVLTTAVESPDITQSPGTPPTQSGTLPVAAIGAVAVVALLAAGRRL